MPKAPKTQEEIDAVKAKILDAALEILYEDGFANLSMRKIAARTEMTAANIYHYFSGKDEIYLAIQTGGFIILHDRFNRIQSSDEAPLAQMEKMIRAYIEFGLARKDQYEIMFSRNTPKYSDYVGTKLEPAATIEKDAALRVAALSTRVIRRLDPAGGHMKPVAPHYQTIRIWTALHGIVSLMNSRVLPEVDPDTDAVIEDLIKDLVNTFKD